MEKVMRIAVASGKGGTGKTTIAVNLAAVLGENGRQVVYLDADVEAPNGHLFLKPEFRDERAVELPVPAVDRERCSACGKCAEVCQYGALIALGQEIAVFADLCHGCGGCSLACPEEAISETGHQVGVVEEGAAGPVRFIRGRLDIGQPLSPPVIRAARERLPAEGVQLIDGPPGTACAAVQAVEGCDYVLLVAESTPFGLHDLRLSVEMLRAMRLRFGVVINRAEEGQREVRDFCATEGIDLLAELPDDRKVAEVCSGGGLIAEEVNGYRERFRELFAAIEGRLAA